MQRLLEIFSSLRLRLLASYALVLLLSLTVMIVVTLVIVLRGRDIPPDRISERLATTTEQINTALEQQNIKIPDNGPTRLQEIGLKGFTQQMLGRGIEIRILLLDSNEILSFDSLRVFKPGSKPTLSSEPYSFDVVSVQPTTPVSLVRGTLTDPDGSPWWFVAQAPMTASPQSQRLMVALKGPPLMTLSELLNLYGADLFWPLLQAGLVGLVAAFVMSLILTRSVARPLQDVAKAVAGVAEGRVDQRAPVRGPLEVRIVAEAFNEMTEQVAHTQQAQRDFLANVTHDLRTPLTSIQGFSQAIIDGVASNPEAAQRAAQIIHDESARLNRMVEELLDLARIEAGKLSMTRQGLQLVDILNAVGERLTPRARDKNLTLTLEIPPSLPIIGGDGDRLAQVYTNLVDNAIKHTPEGGTVTLRAGIFNNGLLVQVCDTGEGIPADDLPHLFDRFFQVDKSRQRQSRDGAGLGLTITKEIVEAHNGRIWVESQEGAWTIFSTWYPVLAPDSTTIIRRRPGLSKSAPAAIVPKTS